MAMALPELGSAAVQQQQMLMQQLAQQGAGGRRRRAAPAAAADQDRPEPEGVFKCQWNEAMHKSFLAAIFEMGLRYAKPKELLTELLKIWDDGTDGDGAAAAAAAGINIKGLHTDHIKSHLQKYRKNAAVARTCFKRQLASSIKEAQQQNKRRAITPHLRAYPICGSNSCPLGAEAHNLSADAADDKAAVAQLRRHEALHYHLEQAQHIDEHERGVPCTDPSHEDPYFFTASPEPSLENSDLLAPPNRHAATIPKPEPSGTASEASGGYWPAAGRAFAHHHHAHSHSHGHGHGHDAHACQEHQSAEPAAHRHGHSHLGHHLHHHHHHSHSRNYGHACTDSSTAAGEPARWDAETPGPGDPSQPAVAAKSCVHPHDNASAFCANSSSSSTSTSTSSGYCSYAHCCAAPGLGRTTSAPAGTMGSRVDAGAACPQPNEAPYADACLHGPHHHQHHHDHSARAVCAEGENCTTAANAGGCSRACHAAAETDCDQCGSPTLCPFEGNEEELEAFIRALDPAPHHHHPGPCTPARPEGTPGWPAGE